MSKVSFTDFYGQYVTVHNETGSGNLRVIVRTTKNINDLAGKKEDQCEIETDISLSESEANILFHAIGKMIDNWR